MNRLLFEKRGDAVYLSHLDLMRVFQRAFKRADILIWHSQGFSPRAYVSIALPLPVGMESRCEILDFEIEDGAVELPALAGRLNAVLPAGIRVLSAYESARKVKELTRLQAHVQAIEEAMASDQPVGRRLDFIVQELNRETNTIGSKAADMQILALVVDIKAEIEKIREQVQNIE